MVVVLAALSKVKYIGRILFYFFFHVAKILKVCWLLLALRNSFALIPALWRSSYLIINVEFTLIIIRIVSHIATLIILSLLLLPVLPFRRHSSIRHVLPLSIIQLKHNVNKDVFFMKVLKLEVCFMRVWDVLLPFFSWERWVCLLFNCHFGALEYRKLQI